MAKVKSYRICNARLTPSSFPEEIRSKVTKRVQKLVEGIALFKTSVHRHTHSRLFISGEMTLGQTHQNRREARIKSCLRYEAATLCLYLFCQILQDRHPLLRIMNIQIIDIFLEGGLRHHLYIIQARACRDYQIHALQSQF